MDKETEDAELEGYEEEWADLGEEMGTVEYK